MTTTVTAQIQLRRDTAANWTSHDPILASGEIGYETDTLKQKMGDGTTSWASLDYYYDPSGLVTNGDSHDHSGGDGAQIAYSGLSGLPTLGSAAATDSTAYEAAGAIATHAALTTAHGISSFGATLVDDADASTARSTLGLGTAAITASTDYAPFSLTLNDQTGTTYTLVLSDAGKLIRASNAAAITLTVPPNASVAFPTGTSIAVQQQGVGQVSIAAGAGVTINSRSSMLKISARYGGVSLVKTASDTWWLEGALGI